MYHASWFERETARPGQEHHRVARRTIRRRASFASGGAVSSRLGDTGPSLSKV